MFLGEHKHSLDDKGRLILPSRFRESLEGAFVTSEIDGCLGLWPPDDFARRAEEMNQRRLGDERDRSVARFFFAYAQEASPDKQGRVALPANLREFASLTREVVVNGAYDHVEVWDAARGAAKREAGEQALASGIR